VPYFKRRFPRIEVLATAAAKDILSRPKVISYIEMVNKLIIDAYGLQNQYTAMNLAIDAIPIDRVVDNSTVIDLGEGVEVHFLETPGHSACALSVCIPKLEAIFPTDSSPCPLGSIDRLARPSPQFDFCLYKQSLARLLEYDIEICGFDHYAAVTGADARKVLQNGLAQSLEYQERIIRLFRENNDFEQVARIVARETMQADEFDFLSEDLMMPISRAEVRNILKDAGIEVVRG
jgi:glyoxylase-like metal-dependent hydrolase (beta-lactamase superfamily II)